jgi:hypothetical protein
VGKKFYLIGFGISILIFGFLGLRGQDIVTTSFAINLGEYHRYIGLFLVIIGLYMIYKSLK